MKYSKRKVSHLALKIIQLLALSKAVIYSYGLTLWYEENKSVFLGLPFILLNTFQVADHGYDTHGKPKSGNSLLNGCFIIKLWWNHSLSYFNDKITLMAK